MLQGTDGLLSQLAARKVFGLGSVTILDVSCVLLVGCSHRRSTSFGSYAPGAASKDGHAMCDARGLWDLPCSRRQGKSAFLWSKIIDDLTRLFLHTSRSSLTISRHSYPRPRIAQTHLRLRRNLMARKTSISSALEALEGVPL